MTLSSHRHFAGAVVLASLLVVPRPARAAQAAPDCWRDSVALAPAGAESPLGRRIMVARRLTGPPPHIDGHLDDPAWCDARPVSDFVQTRPSPGAPATLRTVARIMYDDAAVYVAIRLHDPRPDSIVAPYPRRDDETTSDWAFVEVDSRFDRRSGYSFGLNPRGVQVDGSWADDVNYDAAWNGVWEGAALIDSLGWTAEFRIPYSQIALGTTAIMG